MAETPGKMFRRVRKQRDMEYVPPNEPTTSYKRQFVKTRMHWTLVLILQKRWDVLVVMLFIYGLIIVIVCYGAYLFLRIILSHFGVAI